MHRKIYMDICILYMAICLIYVLETMYMFNNNIINND
jgi:hypothetical protein